MQLSVVFVDKIITIDNISVIFEDERKLIFDSLVEELGHSNFWAIQWNGSSGEIEYNDGKSNTFFEDESLLLPYVNLHNEEINLITNESVKDLLDQDPVIFAKERRKTKFARWNWLIERASSGGKPLSQEWKDWFQTLRDLPDDPKNWNPSLEWDEEKQMVVVVGVNWPKRPDTW